MRAPQYGHNKGKRRTNNAALPPDSPATGRVRRGTHYIMPRYSHVQAVKSETLRSGNDTLILVSYVARQAQRYTKVTMTVWRSCPDIWGNPHDPWAGRWFSKRKHAKLTAAMKKDYMARYGTLAGPIATKKQQRVTETKAALITHAR